MRTKVLCAAALAAGALTSMAQVYSANIVGYVNVSAPLGYTFQSNPLDATPSNSAVNVIPNPYDGTAGQGPWDACQIQTWTGVNWTVAVFDSLTDDSTTGFVNKDGTAPVPAPVLSSGMGYLFYNPNGAATITYVGQVRTGTNTVSIPTSSRPVALGSPLPLSGTPFALGFSNPFDSNAGVGPLDSCLIETLKTTPTGGAAGYAVSAFDSNTDDTTTGFMNRDGTVPVPAPTIGLGQGFFFANPNPTVTWTQVLNP